MHAAARREQNTALCCFVLVGPGPNEKYLVPKAAGICPRLQESSSRNFLSPALKLLSHLIIL